MAADVSFGRVEVIDVARGDVVSPFIQVHAFLPFRYPWNEAGGTVGVGSNVTQQASFVVLSFWCFHACNGGGVVGAGYAFICARTE